MEHVPSIITVERSDLMRVYIVIAVYLSFFLFSVFTMASGYSVEDEQFKKENIDKLKPYGPGFNEDRRPIWQQMMKIAVKYEDYEIVEKILLVRDEVDGVMATQYSLDLFELYKQSPLFFVESVDRFYAGNFDPFLRIWINEAYDIVLDDIKKYSTGHSENTLMKQFLLKAEELDSHIK